MGRTYSLNGYLNAVIQRSTPTLLVEGVTDKAAIFRLVAERNVIGARKISVDHAALFDDRSTRGLGAKAKILLVQVEARKLFQRFQKLENFLGYLLDREWDGLPSDPSDLVVEWAAPLQEGSSFVTNGHSIENYHFDVDCFIEYLRHGFAEHFSHELERLVRSSFGGAIALAGALSFAARDAECISRLSGLLGLKHIEFEIGSGRFYLSQSAVDPIGERCNFDSAAFVAGVNAAVDSHWTALSQSDSSRWVLHGHLGSETLWACIGSIAVRAGAPAEVGEQVSNGFQQERRRFWLTWLSRVQSELRFPLDQTLDWLLGTPADADTREGSIALNGN